MLDAERRFDRIFTDSVRHLFSIELFFDGFVVFFKVIFALCLE